MDGMTHDLEEQPGFWLTPYAVPNKPVQVTIVVPTFSAEATLERAGSQPLRTYRSGFWMRDWNYLLSGPKLTVGPEGAVPTWMLCRTLPAIVRCSRWNGTCSCLRQAVCLLRGSSSTTG